MRTVLPMLAACAAGVVLGVFIGRADSIVYKDELRLDSLANLFTSLLVFVLISLVYSQYASERSGRRQILIGLAQHALDATSDLNDVFITVHDADHLEPGQIRLINNGITKYSNALHSLEAGIRECGIDADNVALTEALSQREEYRAILTDRFPNAYDPSLYRTQQGHHKAIRDTLHKMIFRLNKI